MRLYPRPFRWASLCGFCLLAATLLSLSPAGLAQTGGEGAIQGTVTDPTGAVVPNATVTALDVATSVATARTTSADGFYEIDPIIPGDYVVTAAASGFQTTRQENIDVVALKVTGLNLSLKPGIATATVTVSGAPPALETTNATLGAVMENETYQSLPLSMGGLQRDPTAFATLTPGVQPGSREGVFSGTGNYLSEIYLDGIPLTEASQQGDNRSVSLTVSVDAVNQFQVQTSGISSEYQGAGLENYVIKSGNNKFRGSAFTFVRNTIFDTWGFTAPALTEENAAGDTIPAPKPAEHQEEWGATFGGPIIKDKLFFFVAYDGFHYTAGVRPNLLTVPTVAERAGDFSQLLAANGGPGTPIYDPTSQASCTAHSTTGACRYQFGYGPGAAAGPAGSPTPTGAPINVIPASEISPITNYLQKFLPAPNNNALVNNYLGGVPTGYSNYEYDMRFDYALSDRQRLSFVFTTGSRMNIGYNVGNSGVVLPPPYINGSTDVDIIGHIAALEYSYELTSRVVNQFKFGYMSFGGPPVRNGTEGVTQYEATTAGITGLPPGQASTEFPGASFNGNDAPSPWTANSSSAATYTSVSENYTILDNLQWLLGKHSLTFGGQLQWLEDNASTYDGPSSNLTLNWNTNETAGVKGANYVGNSGNSYASYLLGAVGSTGVTIQPFSDLGGRYRPIAPYFEDDWKVTPRLTLNLGLRWDYLPPYHEALARYSFLSPGSANAVTGNPGELLFAGSRGVGSCNCATPIHTYWNNWGPRLGLAYSLGDKTVVRASYGLFYSHGGGVGGRAGAASGTGQLGFSVSPNFNDSVQGPAFYLNNSPGLVSAGLANTNFGGPGYVLPAPSAPGPAQQILSTGNYLTSSGAFVQAATAPGYADPYLSGRAPTFGFFNFGLQRSLAQNTTITVNYAGSQSHFIANSGDSRGYWSNLLNPVYMPLGSLLSAPATAANIAAADAIIPGIAAPYPGYVAAASTPAGAGHATIGQMLVAFPQYAGGNDIWGNNSNANYNSFQLALAQRFAHGFSFTLNYTYSKELDDAGTFRTGFAIPAFAIDSHRAYPMDRIERAPSTIEQPEVVTGYGVYQLPFGRSMKLQNSLLRSVADGWQISGIFRYSSGSPLAIIASNCTGSNFPAVHQCMPDVNPAFQGPARQNGGWGHGITAANLGAISYINSAAFTPASSFTVGDAPRTAPYNLFGPGGYDIDGSIRRTFPIHEEVSFLFQADVFNLTNTVQFGNIGVNATAGGLGTVGSQANSSRDWQFSGRINF